MKRNFIVAVAVNAVLITVIGVPSSTLADCDTSKCDHVLVKDYVNYGRKTHVALAFLSLLDSTNFDELKRNLDTSGDIVYAGIPMKGDFKYGDLQKSLQKRMEKLQMNYERDEATNLVTSYLSPGTVPAWSKCIEDT